MLLHFLFPSKVFFRIVNFAFMVKALTVTHLFVNKKHVAFIELKIKLMFTERFCVFVNLAVGGLESGPDRRIPDGLQNNQCRRFDGFLTVTVIKHDIFFHGPQNKRK